MVFFSAPSAKNITVVCFYRLRLSVPEAEELEEQGMFNERALIRASSSEVSLFFGPLSEVS